MFAAFRDKQKEQRLFKHRAIILALFLSLLFTALVWRLWYLQVTSYDTYSNLSENNRLQLRPIAPSRGLIYDRNGVLLAENIPSFSLTLTPERVKNMERTLQFLDELIGLSIDQEQMRSNISIRRRPFEAITLKQRLNNEEIAKVMVNRNFLPGIEVEAQLMRHYPLGKSFAHILGYVARINSNEQATLDADPDLKRNYSATNFIGKMGAEKRYEQDLHGLAGYEKVETNAHGRVISVVERKDPVPGNDIALHLDARLQVLAEEQMQDWRGALVAIEVETGGILSIYSNPSFDPNLFVGGISYSDYNALRDDLDLPLFDRTTRGRYPPASTLKPFVGLAILESGSSTWAETINDKGHFQLPNDERIYRDWRREGHGLVNLERAIVESCDTYFYEMSVRTGIDDLSSFLAQFGFGRNMAYDIDYALSGILPDREWKRAHRRSFWFAGDTVNFGIGQGFTLTTPLQLATATAVLANKGKWQVPRLIYKHDDQQDIIEHGEIADIILKDPENWERMNLAMEKVVSSLRGTAHRLHDRHSYSIAAKTGTAQVVSISQEGKYDSEALQERLRDHALFIAFAPADAPKIAIAVVIENGESAGRTAGPIAKRIMDTYLNNLKLDEAKHGES